MRIAILWMTAAALVAGLAGGCDDKDEGVSQEVLRAQERAQRQLQELAKTPPRPTTQELLAGPKKRVQLADFPLTLEVPQSWGLRSEGEGRVIKLGGPASSAEIEIQLSNPGMTPIRADLVGRAVRDAKAEAEAKPHPFNKVEMRDLGGGAKVLELRMISTEFVNGKLPPEREEEVVIGDPAKGPTLTTRAVVNPHMMKWNFTVYLPEGSEKYATRTLNFIGLRVSEFAQDREFLEKMMGTLKYEK